MATLTGLWHGLSNSLLWVCLSLFLLRGVGKTRTQTGIHYTVQKRIVPGSVSGSSGPSLARRPPLEEWE